MSEQQQRLRILNGEIVALNKERDALFLSEKSELTVKELNEIDEVLNACFDEKAELMGEI